MGCVGEGSSQSKVIHLKSIDLANGTCGFFLCFPLMLLKLQLKQNIDTAKQEVKQFSGNGNHPVNSDSILWRNLRIGYEGNKKVGIKFIILSKYMYREYVHHMYGYIEIHIWVYLYTHT